jgi:hypothetical protein
MMTATSHNRAAAISKTITIIITMMTKKTAAGTPAFTSA